MSTEYTCDNCGTKEQKPENLMQPKDWMQITVNGYVPRKIKEYGGQVTVKKDICLDCAIKIFPQDGEDVSLQAQFEEVARNLIHDIVAEIVEDNYSGAI